MSRFWWHAAHHTHFTADYGTAPPFPYRVMRGQYLATLAAGGRGFAGYASDFFLPEPRLRIGLPHLWREVRFLEPFLECGDLSPLSVGGVAALGLGLKAGEQAEPNPKESGSAASQSGDKSPHSKEILAWIGTCGEHVALIVMNSGMMTRRVTIKHPALTMSELAVVSEAREVAIKDGALTDEIPAGEACVYSTEARGLKLPTVAQIEADDPAHAEPA
jgi:hypothetical protein